jgi:hypothetical protein
VGGVRCLTKSVVPPAGRPLDRSTAQKKESPVGIRETLNKNPSITTGVTIGIIVVALIAIIYQAFFYGRPNLSPPRSFYSTDDGKTWFDAEADKIPPFDHNGAQAVRVFVFRCGEKGTPFVGYMERYTPEAAKKMAELSTAGSTDDPMVMEQLQMTGVEIKKPGDAKWYLRNTPAAERIMDVKCPDGSTTGLEPVSPMD